ncbi:MAG: hypothetical protein M1813_008727 [Trichoglossum hirsutum]|nr:MAG: hypothetical protein M1813_008727 [Trichoglossum hirsutum]
MVMTWNDKADVRLFVNVLKIHNIKLDYVEIAKAMGDNVTAKAITHRISKLRQIAAEEESAQRSGSASADGTGSGADNSAAATPAKRRRTSKAKATKNAAATTSEGPKKRGRKPKIAPKKELTPVTENEEGGTSDDRDSADAKVKQDTPSGETTVDEEDYDEAPSKKRIRRGKSGSVRGD